MVRLTRHTGEMRSESPRHWVDGDSQRASSCMLVVCVNTRRGQHSDSSTADDKLQVDVARQTVRIQTCYMRHANLTILSSQCTTAAV